MQMFLFNGKLFMEMLFIHLINPFFKTNNNFINKKINKYIQSLSIINNQFK